MADFFTNEIPGSGWRGGRTYEDQLRRNQLREQGRARVAGGEDIADVMNDLGPRLYGKDYQPIESAAQREMRARSILNKPVTTTTPTGRYLVDQPTGETAFPTSRRPSDAFAPPEQPFAGRVQSLESQAAGRVGLPSTGDTFEIPPAGVMEPQSLAGPTGLGQSYQTRDILEKTEPGLTQGIRRQAREEQRDRDLGPQPGDMPQPEQTFRREPIERRRVQGPETETTSRPITLSEAFTQTQDPKDYRSLRQYGPQIETERGFDVLEQNLRAGKPFDQAVRELTPTMMRGAKANEWDSIIKAVQATQTGDYETLAQQLEQKGDYMGAIYARAGNARLLFQHLVNQGRAATTGMVEEGKNQRAEAERQALDAAAERLDKQGYPEAAALVRAGKAGAPAASVVGTGMTQQGQTARQTGKQQWQATQNNLDRVARKELEMLRNDNRLAVANVARGGADARQAGLLLQDLRVEYREVSKNLLAHQKQLGDAKLYGEDPAPIEGAITELQDRLREITEDQAEVRARLRAAPATPGQPPPTPGATPGPAPATPPTPGPTAPPRRGPRGPRPQGDLYDDTSEYDVEPEGRVPGAPGGAPQAAGATPRDRLDQLARARFGVSFMDLSRADRATIVQQFNASQ